MGVYPITVHLAENPAGLRRINRPVRAPQPTLTTVSRREWRCVETLGDEGNTYPSHHRRIKRVAVNRVEHLLERDCLKGPVHHPRRFELVHIIKHLAVCFHLVAVPKWTR